MKKSLFLAGLAVLTFSVSGMNFPNPNDQGNSENNRRRNFQQIDEGNEDGRRVRARTNASDHAPSNNNLIAWFKAVRSNDLGEMKRFSQGLDICSQDQSGNTALHIASSNGNLEIVQYLVEHGADVNKAGYYGIPLFEAIRGGYPNIIQYLVEHGADIDKADDYGDTPLHMAIREGYPNIVRYLVEHGADVDKADRYGATPLFEAIRGGYPNIIQYLVEHGADVNKEDRFGDTPLSEAARRGQDIVQYLVEHGAYRKGKRRAEGAEDIQYDISAKKAKRDN